MPFTANESISAPEGENSDISVVLFVTCQFLRCQRKPLAHTSIHLCIYVCWILKETITSVFLKWLDSTGLLHLQKHLVAQWASCQQRTTDPTSDMTLSSLWHCTTLNERLTEFNLSPRGESDKLTYKHTVVYMWPVSLGHSSPVSCGSCERSLAGWHNTKWK